jgi:hypothetical protein
LEAKEINMGMFTMLASFLALLPAEARFMDDTGATAPLSGTNDPAAFYDPASDTTWLSFEGWNGDSREVVTTHFDHAAAAYGLRETAGRTPLEDDHHGTPAIIKDHEGYLHAFYGAHNSPIFHSSTRWPVDSEPGDGPRWSIRGPISTGAYTYPRVETIDGTMYLFARKTGTRGAHRVLVLLETTALSDGLATWGAEREIADFGAGTRFYGSRIIRVGTEIHFVATKADAPDTERLHLYYFIYDTADGSLSSYDRSTTVAAGGLPINLATADADFRVVESTGENRTNIPGFERDSLGRMHVVYPDGEGLRFDLKHIMLSGGAWSKPVTIGTVDGLAGEGYIEAVAVTRTADDAIAVYWPYDPHADFDKGGDMVRRVRSSTGAWGELETIMRAGERALATPVTIRDGHSDARVIFTEILQRKGDDAGDNQAGGLRVYLLGNRGLLRRS